MYLFIENNNRRSHTLDCRSRDIFSEQQVQISFVISARMHQIDAVFSALAVYSDVTDDRSSFTMEKFLLTVHPLQEFMLLLSHFLYLVTFDLFFRYLP